jgi:hypothetical protein
MSEAKRYKIEPFKGTISPISETEWNITTHHLTSPVDLVLGVKDKSQHVHPLQVRTDEEGNLYLEVKP